MKGTCYFENQDSQLDDYIYDCLHPHLQVDGEFQSLEKMYYHSLKTLQLQLRKPPHKFPFSARFLRLAQDLLFCPPKHMSFDSMDKIECPPLHLAGLSLANLRTMILAQMAERLNLSNLELFFVLKPFSQAMILADFLVNKRFDQDAVGYEELFSEEEITDIIVPCCVPYVLYFREHNGLNIEYLQEFKSTFQKSFPEDNMTPEEDYLHRVVPLIMKQVIRLLSSHQDMKGLVGQSIALLIKNGSKSNLVDYLVRNRRDGAYICLEHFYQMLSLDVETKVMLRSTPCDQGQNSQAPQYSWQTYIDQYFTCRKNEEIEGWSQHYQALDRFYDLVQQIFDLRFEGVELYAIGQQVMNAITRNKQRLESNRKESMMIFINLHVFLARKLRSRTGVNILPPCICPLFHLGIFEYPLHEINTLTHSERVVSAYLNLSHLRYYSIYKEFLKTEEDRAAQLNASTALANLIQICTQFLQQGSKGKIYSKELENIMTLGLAYARQWGFLKPQNFVSQYIFAFQLPPIIEPGLKPLYSHIIENEALFLSKIPLLIQQHSKPIKRALFQLLGFYIARDMAQERNQLKTILKENFLSWRRNLNYVVLQSTQQFSNDSMVKGVFERIFYFSGPVSIGEHQVCVHQRRALRMKSTYFNICSYEQRVDELIKDCSTLFPEHYFLAKMTEQALTEEMQVINPRRFIMSQQNQLCKDILPILFPLQPQPSQVKTQSQLGTEEAKNVSLIAVLNLLISKFQPEQEQDCKSFCRLNYFKILLPLAGRCPQFARAITPLIILKYAGSDPRMVNDIKSSSSTGSTLSDRNLILLTFSAAQKSKDPALAQAFGEAFLYLNRLHLNVNKKISAHFKKYDKLKRLELSVLRHLVKGKDQNVNALVLQTHSNKEFKDLVEFTQTLAIMLQIIPLDALIRGTTLLPDKSLSVVLLEYKHFQHKGTPSDTNLLEQIRQIEDEANSSNSVLKTIYVQSQPPEIEVPLVEEIQNDFESQFELSKIEASETATVPKQVAMVQEFKQSSKLTQMSVSRDVMTHPFPYYSLSQSSDSYPVNPNPSFLLQPKPLTIFERLNQLKNTHFLFSSGSIPYVLNQPEVLEKKPAFSRIIDLLTQIMFLVGGLIKQKSSESVISDLEVNECLQQVIRKYADLTMDWLCKSYILPDKSLYRIFLTVLFKILHITGHVSQILEKQGPDSQRYDRNMFELSEKELNKLIIPLTFCGHIETLVTGLEECEQSFDVLYLLNMCYFLLFKALDRKQEAAIFLRELIRQHLKHRDQIPMHPTATQDLIEFQDYMVEFQLYQATIIKETGLVNDVLGILTESALSKMHHVQKEIRSCAQPLQRYLSFYFDRDIFLRSSLLRLEVLSRSFYKDKDKIFTKEATSHMRGWPQFNFFYAKILDEVNEINSPLADVDLLNKKDRTELQKRSQSEQCPPLEKLKLKIKLYVQACIGDDRYIMSGLGRALQIYFDTLLHPQFWRYQTLAERSAQEWIHQFDSVDIYKYCPLVTQLLYRLNQFDAVIKLSHKENLPERVEELWRKPLFSILTRILNDYPKQNLWWFMSLLLRDIKAESEISCPDKLKRSNRQSSQCLIAESILQNLKKESKTIVTSALPFFKALLAFSMKVYKQDKPEMPIWLQNFKKINVLMPCDQFIQPRLSTGKQTNRQKGVPLNLKDTLYPPEHQLVYIYKVERFFSIIRSKECPKKFSMVGSDGKKYDFLLKVRLLDTQNNVSSRVSVTSNQKVAMSFVRAANTLLSQDPDAVRFNLSLKCFSIVPVGASGMIIEWVKGLCSLKEKIMESSSSEGLRVEFGDMRMILSEKQVREYLGDKWEQVMKVAPPSLHNFMLLDFEEPKQLRRAISTWTKQLACWSYVGYFLGFGDRHCDNILIDPKTAELMHVDFECVMDKGTTLPIPEIVPFRMTKNIASPLGAASFNGLFKDIALTVIKLIRRNAAVLATIINTFKGTELREDGGHDSKGVMIACKRLLGKDAPMDMKDHTAAMVPFSEEEQFKNAIMVATSPLNLKKMYTGWMPWL